MLAILVVLGSIVVGIVLAELVFWCWFAGITYLLWGVVEVVDRITERITR